MTKYPQIAFLLCLTVASAFGQFGPRPGGLRGPQIDAPTAKLFGDNSSFSATLTLEAQGADPAAPAGVTGKLAFDQGKSRFEIDLTKMMTKMPPEVLSQMKSMGMDLMVAISTPGSKFTSMVYPGLKAYVEMPSPDADSTNTPGDFKLETTELAKETLDGHPCVKAKAIVTDKAGTKHESTVWNATDLKQFPIRIEQIEQGKPNTLVFKDITFSKPDASLFAPPADFTKYDGMQSMMQQIIMKQMGGALGGTPPAKPPGGP